MLGSGKNKENTRMKGKKVIFYGDPKTKNGQGRGFIKCLNLVMQKKKSNGL